MQDPLGDRTLTFEERITAATAIRLSINGATGYSQRQRLIAIAEKLEGKSFS